MVNFTKNQVWKDIITGCKFLVDIAGIGGVFFLMYNMIANICTGSEHDAKFPDASKGKFPANF